VGIEAHLVQTQWTQPVQPNPVWFLVVVSAAVSFFGLSV